MLFASALAGARTRPIAPLMGGAKTMNDYPSIPTTEQLIRPGAGRHNTLARILALSFVALLAFAVCLPPTVAAHGDPTQQCRDEDHHSDQATHHHLPDHDGAYACSADLESEFTIANESAGSEYVTKLLRSELGGYIERFARWAAVGLLLYSVVWMLWPLFQSSRGGGEQRKVFKNLVLPLVVAAIAFDLSITGTIFDFFIGLVDAAGNTFSDLF